MAADKQMIKNALDAIEGNGTISITATANEDNIVIDVTDTIAGTPHPVVVGSVVKVKTEE